MVSKVTYDERLKALEGYSCDLREDVCKVLTIANARKVYLLWQWYWFEELLLRFLLLKALCHHLRDYCQWNQSHWIDSRSCINKELRWFEEILETDLKELMVLLISRLYKFLPTGEEPKEVLIKGNQSAKKTKHKIGNSFVDRGGSLKSSCKRGHKAL